MLGLALATPGVGSFPVASRVAWSLARFPGHAKFGLALMAADIASVLAFGAAAAEPQSLTDVLLDLSLEDPLAISHLGGALLVLVDDDHAGGLASLLALEGDCAEGGVGLGGQGLQHGSGGANN